MGIRLNLYILILVTAAEILIFKSVTAVTSYGSCYTPNRLAATCVDLQDCRYLYELLQEPDLSQNDRQYLSLSQCGYINRKVLICCPESYLTRSATTPAPGRASPSPPAPPQSPAPAAKSPASRPNTNQKNSLLLQHPQCGNSLGSRIYGGTRTLIDEFPWMALIEYTRSNNVKGHYCGGTLINERYVLTAAHCVKSSDLPADLVLTGVRLGEWDTRTNVDCDDGTCAPMHQDIAVQERIAHPDYANRNDPNDIALLRLVQPATFNDFVQPICLPLTTALRNDNFINSTMDVAGWGSTETGSTSSPVKLKAELKVKELEVCRQKYSQLSVRLLPTQMCVGGESGIDTCRGDSGGPLMVQSQVNRKAVYFLVGVVSYGPTPCGLQGWPAIYTKVGSFMDWIVSSMHS